MWRGIQIWSCFGEKRRFANFLHLVQLLCQGPSLYRQCYSILNLVSTFSHIYGAVCVLVIFYTPGHLDMDYMPCATFYHCMLRRCEVVEASGEIWNEFVGCTVDTQQH